MKHIYNILLILLAISGINAQDSIIGNYQSMFIVNGFQLQIRPHNNFELKEIGNHLINQNGNHWTGKWNISHDTLILDFIDDSIVMKHIIENRFLIRTNIKETLVTDDTMIIEVPGYLFLTEGLYPNGTIRCQTTWADYSSMTFQAKREGEWKFYYPQGGIKRIENYKNGMKHGDFKFYRDNGYLIRVEKWRNDKFIKVKKSP